MFTVTAGVATLSAGQTDCELTVGDTANYRADLNHTISNDGTSELKGYLVVTYK